MLLRSSHYTSNTGACVYLAKTWYHRSLGMQTMSQSYELQNLYYLDDQVIY